MRKASSKDRIRHFLLANVGKVLTSEQIREAAQASEWARRVRELREDENWPIRTQNDNASLKPGEYMLENLPPMVPIKFGRGISMALRAAVLDRNGFTCQMCGLSPGDVDPDTGRSVRLHIGHIKDKSLGGEDELSNLRALCSSCNQGAKNVTSEKPTATWLLSQVRRAGIDDQKSVYEWLKKKFEGK